ncbi:hypothetical protein FSP39_007796 [Pinctada imbricata]|uniref:RWD domain-containing protein n=1 Tax=Pinctada imbricata TaxID=66713 RepID=A0AA88YN19_PINIB|nr:hypothetical protein FSP39_007796 [Pinctada imbricata]
MEGEKEVPTNMSVQESEISDIKNNFNGRCRVIKDLGDFTHVVTLEPEGKEITLKFQLTREYPDKKPTVIVRSSKLSDEQSQQLLDTLDKMASTLLGKLMILGLVKSFESWVSKHSVKLDKSEKVSGKYEKRGKQNDKDKRRKRKEQQEAEELVDEKKASMKTADDVIKRILWDSKLCHDDFLVGYIDRFTGLQEKYFTSFSWEDLATVDYNVLAIPKHRIEYFKYKDVIIWHKTKKIDNVFGSLGSKLTMYDVVENYEKEKEKQEMQQICGSKNISATEEEQNDDSSDDDSDDGITVTVGAQARSGAGAMNYDISDEEMIDEEDDSYDPYWRNKMRPNYFLALRVTDEEVRKTSEQLQDIILEHEPQFEECRVLPHNLHITLCTVGLDTPEQIAHCAEVLKKLHGELSTFVPKSVRKVPIKITGVDQFFNRVVYAKAQFPQEYLDLVDHLKLCLQNEGVEIRDNHDFVPHMTLMKITRPVGSKTGKKYVAPWIYAEKSELEFGSQVFDNMHLCEMGPSRREDGFYMTPVSLEF